MIIGLSLCAPKILEQNLLRLSKGSHSKKKKSIYIQQANLIKLYNANMGGVDRCDENISLYRTSLRMKKWYFPLISQCLDMSIHNAWQLHKLANQNSMDHLTFRRQVAVTLLEQNKRETLHTATGRPGRYENFAIRFDRIDHYVIPQDKQTKCRHCHQKTTTRCQRRVLTVPSKIKKNYNIYILE